MLQIKNLSKQYDGKTVVHDVSFHIPKGKVISMIGPNGAGKSTVMGILSRLIARDSGLVEFAGKDISQRFGCFHRQRRGRHGDRQRG